MAILSWLFGCAEGDGEKESGVRFVSEQSFRENLAKQTTMTPQTMQQLRDYGVTHETTLRLEFFFYTDAQDKANSLVKALTGSGYEVQTRASAGKDRLLLITGWTTPLTMQDASVVAWTERMVRLGYEHDCEFDDWGTNPEQ